MSETPDQESPMKCGREGCQPEVGQHRCCGIDYVVRCHCGKQETGGSIEEAVRFWNYEIKNEVKK